MKQFSIAPLLLYLAFISCNRIPAKEVIIPSDWVKQSLPDGWVIYTPESFSVRAGHGTDSYVGQISSQKDSIDFIYDIGFLSQYYEICCSFRKSLNEARRELKDSIINEAYSVPNINEGHIEIVDHKVATIYTPKLDITGDAYFEIAYWKEAKYIGFDVMNLSRQKQQLVLQIFRTVRLEKKREMFPQQLGDAIPLISKTQ